MTPKSEQERKALSRASLQYLNADKSETGEETNEKRENDKSLKKKGIKTAKETTHESGEGARDDTRLCGLIVVELAKQ